MGGGGGEGMLHVRYVQSAHTTGKRLLDLIKRNIEQKCKLSDRHGILFYGTWNCCVGTRKASSSH